jgi:hypothetical protein
MNNQHPRSEFTDVDQADTPQNYVECLDSQHNEAERWIAYVEDAIRNDRFFRAMTYFITTGHKPT